jgi:hypothetical protein
VRVKELVLIEELVHSMTEIILRGTGLFKGRLLIERALLATGLRNKSIGQHL